MCVSDLLCRFLFKCIDAHYKGLNVALNRKQLKEAEIMLQRMVIKPPYIKSHKLMGVLWAHTGAIGCIVLSHSV